MGVKISDLPASAGAALAMQFEVNNASTSERLTLAQMFALSTGAVVADSPLLSFAQTWNNAAVAFTALKLNITNAASATASKLLDLQVAGASKFSVGSSSVLFVDNINGSIGAYSSVHFCTSLTGTSPVVSLGGSSSGASIRSDAAYAFTSESYTSDFAYRDTFVVRDAANTVALRNGVNAQTFRLYNTFTDASNYERGGLTWNTNRLFISTESGGTGTARSIRVVAAGELELGASNADRWRISSAGHFLAQADNAYEIGALGAGRPRAIYVAAQVSANSFWLAAGGSGYWDADFLVPL